MKYYYRQSSKTDKTFFKSVIENGWGAFKCPFDGGPFGYKYIIYERSTFILEDGEIITLYADDLATLELKTNGFIPENWVLGHKSFKKTPK